MARVTQNWNIHSDFALNSLELYEPFDITNEILDQYQEAYIKSSNTKGLQKSKSNTKFNRRMAALVLTKYKLLKGFDVKEGFLYAISNPAWPDALKIGMTIDTVKRLQQYQTYSPFRDYKLEWYRFVFSRRDGERALHSLFNISNLEGEWFNITKSKLLEIEDSTWI